MNKYQIRKEVIQRESRCERTNEYNNRIIVTMQSRCTEY